MFTIGCLFSFLQKAFSAVQQLWGQKLPKEYGPHMAESMLAILYHIIKGEAVIKEKLGPAAESSSSTSGSSTVAAARPADEPSRAQPEINMRHLQQVQYTYWCAFILLACGGHRQIYLTVPLAPRPVMTSYIHVAERYWEIFNVIVFILIR